MVAGLVVGAGVESAVGWSMMDLGWPWLGSKQVVREWLVVGMVLVPVGSAGLEEIGLGGTLVVCHG